MNSWVSAARPRTLPLALSSILMGNFLAAAANQFDWAIGVLACLTTILLQVLSNLANDYGDAVNGKDTDARVGPARAVQSGAISAEAMRRAMRLFALLSLGAGVGLLYVALQNATAQTFWVFLGIGVLAIVAAVTYTAGKNPYGYVGLGDLSVLVFFGWVGVLGSYYLQTQRIDFTLLLPASSCGLFAVGVLNLNNMRDIESDALTGKRSIPVRLGRAKSVVYHWLLLLIGMACSIVFLFINQPTKPLQWLFLLSFPLFIRNGMVVSKTQNPRDLDPYLKQMALSTLLFVLLFGIGLLMAS
ncbi:MAG: 1,4-dihydroxy-2-naphthoate polyprenyltransferase [Cytophagia bacterium]|nr:MAG: 1,4-dihydroxy-2-naphthoate polyprenyltransferase [Runella sp.]TAG22723.1 MAG: 1,4-dihydroxy-2-naphthoate polyprenyltransferase [Cytophagales bacterium]TAG41809.1 MAG: 1,4-dihydroxy-2-naphthoate polyprenyltransferase [Cytophagia bacterium]TAG52001.1 MAG: 1,4-dihydroxy-2-naphthoate polyprenyltransferase [Runella slithyformis]TAG83546.1 MAG: 1,4-dihydroxy-2-naphthoate polyprenyltransferase [Cytophagales bacterium]